MKFTRLFLMALLSGSAALLPAADFSLNGVYGSHMVLQQKKPILLAGRAEPGAEVSVSFDGKTRSAKAGADGKWEVTFPAKEAGGPWTITCQCGKEKIVLEDVMAGEVWFCSGQSNMSMPVWSGSPGWSEREGNRFAKEGSDKDLRLFNVNPVPSFDKPVDQPQGSWQCASYDTIVPFSATAFHFGQELRKRLNVPVGLIACSWGGTRIETWITEEGYRQAGSTKELDQIDRWRANPSNKTFFAKELKNQKTWEEKFYAAHAEKSKAAEKWLAPGFDDSKWQSVTLPGYGPMEDATDGVICYRKTVEIKPAWAGKDMTLSLGMVDDADHTYFNGELIGATGMERVSCHEVKRSYRIPGRLVKAGKAVIAVRVADFSGRGGMLGPKGEMVLKVDRSLTKKIMLAGEWKCAVEFRYQGEAGARPPVVRVINQQFPASLARGSVTPWFRYPVRGVIWYQGESNAWSDPVRYEAQFKLLISDWRRAWNEPEMPFVFVQLASFLDQRSRPFSNDELLKRQPVQYVDWAVLRESQAAALSLPATGMAVAIDQGDPADIHPHDKRVISARLAAEAARIAYGETGVTSGPVFDKVRFENSKAILSFRQLGGGLVVRDGGKINAFAICGKDGKYVWADAEIRGNEIVVSSGKVKSPVAVRYAWDVCPYKPNVFNKEGFPLVPFRTDKKY